MNNQSVKRFQSALKSANGDKAKMESVFKTISAYLTSSVLRKKRQQNLEDYLNENPRVKRIHEWSGTVMVNNEYELLNF